MGWLSLHIYECAEWGESCTVCPAHRPPPCLAVVPWTPPNYFIARVLAMSESQSAPDQ